VEENKYMDKVMELLEQLANSLGVAVEYLWTTLVKQQYVEGVTNLVIAVVGVIVTIVLLCWIPRATKYFINQYKELAEDRRKNGTGFEGSYRVSSYREDFCSFLRFTVPIIGFIAIFIIVLCTVNDIKLGIQQLLNPDYFALKEVLDVISGS
jgi:amino acid permease